MSLQLDPTIKKRFILYRRSQYQKQLRLNLIFILDGQNYFLNKVFFSVNGARSFTYKINDKEHEKVIETMFFFIEDLNTKLKILKTFKYILQMFLLY